MKKLFAAAAGIFGSVPGISILLSGLATPPGYGRIFGGIIEAFGVLAILLLMVNRSKLKRLTQPQVTLSAIVLCAASFCFLAGYFLLFNYCVVSHPIHGTVYYPLWNSGRALAIVEQAGGRYAAVDRYGFYPVEKAIQQAPNYPLQMVVTTSLLLLLYQGVFTSLTLAFGMIGARDDVSVRKILETDRGKAPKRAVGSKKVKSVAPNS